MESLLNELVENSIRPNQVTLNHFIRFFERENDLESMIKYFNRFLELGIKPFPETIASIIGSIGKTGDIKRMLEFFEKTRKIYVDRNIYNAVLQGYQIANNLEESFKIIEQMEQDQMEPDKTSFIHLFNLAGQRKRHDLLDELLKYKNDNFMIPFDTDLTTNILVNSGNCSNYEATANLIEYLQKMGVQIQYNTLILLMRKIIETGSKSNKNIQFSYLLNAYLKPERKTVASAKELEELSFFFSCYGVHRESIDLITIPSKQGKGVLRRVPEVFDCWFESGSMPYAQQHYPFENEKEFKEGFPADFIAEGIDQTRGWFYTLMVISTALFDKPAFKNLVCNGLVLAEDGKKMSKRLKNYPDPNLVVSAFGADALRLYLINSPAVRAENLRFA